MIEAEGLTKRYGSVVAVDDLTFTVRPSRVTGFLGPNGAGKSTTMRLVLGLDRPTSGRSRVAGVPYLSLPRPLEVVGAVLDAAAVHPARRAEAHLRWLARSNGIGPRRVAEVLDFVGLVEVARRRVGTYSLGMRQRLGIAAALLGDPEILLFDEPINGLDPEGIIWIRGLLRSLAREGRTVLVSSHLMSEMAVTADHLLVIGRGALIADASVEEFVSKATAPATRVRCAQPGALRVALERSGAHVGVEADGSFIVTGVRADEIGRAALETATVLSELAPVRASLEDAYLELTASTTQFAAHVVGS